MKNESKFYHEIKKNIPQIKWIRIENSVVHGVADLLGYNDNSRLSILVSDNVNYRNNYNEQRTFLISSYP